MFIIFGNYSDETIALVAWMHQQGHIVTHCVNIDTGWSAPSWHDSLSAITQWVAQLGITPVTLTSQSSFADLVKQRRAFPNQKFQWCAGTLKGLTFMNWLDEIDPDYEATIVLPRRRALGITHATLTEHVEQSEHYGDRDLWHPLFDHTNEMRDTLIREAGFEPTHQRALECECCINANLAALRQMSQESIDRTVALEQAVEQPMFMTDVYGNATDLQTALTTTPSTQTSEETRFDMGCGNPYVCGS